MATFGNTNVETDLDKDVEDKIRGNAHTCPEAGTADSITAYLTYVGTNIKVKYALYKKSDDTLVAETEEITISADGWHTANFAAPKPSLTNQDYVLAVWADGVTYIRSGNDSWYRYYKASAYGSYPNPFDGTTGDSLYYKMSIYCTYTPSGGGVPIGAISGGHYISHINGKVKGG